MLLQPSVNVNHSITNSYTAAPSAPPSAAPPAPPPSWPSAPAVPPDVPLTKSAADSQASRPRIALPDFCNIPPELRELRRWILWRSRSRRRKRR